MSPKFRAAKNLLIKHHVFDDFSDPHHMISNMIDTEQGVWRSWYVLNQFVSHYTVLTVLQVARILSKHARFNTPCS
jgi:hypothetical protein